MNKNRWLPTFIFILSLGPWARQPALAAEPVSASRARNACTGSEKWEFSESLSQNDIKGFKDFLSSTTPAVQGFAEGLALRRHASNEEAQFFAEYWISRSLLEAKLIHTAFNGFNMIAMKPMTARSSGIQLAALECMLKIHALYPSFTVPETSLGHLMDYLREAENFGLNEIVWEAAGVFIRAELAKEKPNSSKVENAIALLKNSGPHEHLGKGLFASLKHEHTSVVSHLGNMLSASSLPARLERYVDNANILMGRSLYALGQFDRAAHHFKQVKKNSNELAEALSELGWSTLMAERYSEAIGSAVSLQAGSLRHTFAPESPMVMAMALNEICQYPEAIKAINIFRKNYETSYGWLAKGRGGELYPVALKYLKKQDLAPRPVASEWVRSPVFIASQEEINLLIDEKPSGRAIAAHGSSHTRNLTEATIKFARELKPRFRAAKLKLIQEGTPLPKKIKDDLEFLRSQVVLIRGLREAAPVLRKIQANGEKQAPALRASLISRVNADLSSRSERMFRQLEEIAENVQLIEVEIYNGASHDIIWQNAHKDYKEVAQKLSDESARETAAKVWNWGKARLGSEEASEIWEDELGSFKVNLFDNCSSKDRYLALRRR